MRLSLPAFLAGAIALCAALPVHAVGTRIDVQVVDRATGETLTPILHDGAWWIAGRPGARYGVTLADRSGRRTLAVLSIDGVNAISGETAAWGQTGYVLDAYARTEVDGWRKSVEQVAAFEFTALPDSYAARTGRPGDVGVIGVALFEAARSPVLPRRLANPAAAERAAPAANDAVPAPAAPLLQDDREAASRAEAPREKLGTGHGALEASSIRYVDFRRARSTPDEVVTIRYDRRENLVAMGILPAVGAPLAANPFPGSARFVADPPPR